jgi:hypothetical protein
MIILRIFIFIWPFIKEMVLGDKTLKTTIITYKKRVLLITLIFISFGMNLFTIPRLFVISNQYLNLMKKKNTDCTKSEHVAIPNKDTAVSETKDYRTIDNYNTNYTSIKRDFDRLNKKENNN